MLIRAARSYGLLIAFAFALTGLARADEPDLGYDLFHRDWSAFDQISPAEGDGLGPFYNARSCVACHHQGGSGGGGAAEHDVELLTLSTIPATGIHAAPDRYSEFNMTTYIAQPDHPGLATQSSVVVHRYHVGGLKTGLVPPAERYDRMRARWLEADPVKILGAFNAQSLGRFGVSRPNDSSPRLVALIRSRRNTPALFGSQLIDAIPIQSLEKLAHHQNSIHPEISGRVAPGGGKFGWRGQMATLEQFVVGACANELGLQTKRNPQPADFVTNSESQGADMYDEQVVALVNYVRELEPPGVMSQDRASKAERAALLRGRRHFSRARCDACHVSEIGTVAGIYSDLLLHDMGPELSDPAALSPSLSGRGYYGTANLIAATDESKQEWRTPPLWGVAQSPPYLHDGRADSIEAAIIAHGGEAETSIRLFHRLPEKARQELVAFVRSL